MNSESLLRNEITVYAKSMFDRELCYGSAGNLSVRIDENTYLITPTNSSFGFLEENRLSKVDQKGITISGDQASKEIFMHLAYYEERSDINAIVHLHSTYLTALSCLQNLDANDCLPPITPYSLMRVGKVPLIGYLKPGSNQIASEVKRLAKSFNAILLANHGVIATGKNLKEAMFNVEELEAAARHYFILKNEPFNQLSTDDVNALLVR